MDEPDIVGNCEACRGEIYDYEETTCDTCEMAIHTSCKKECAQCGHEGCKGCMIYDDESGEYFCGDECKEEFNLEQE